MSTFQSEKDFVDAARLHAKGNRKEIEASKLAECFSCCGVFKAKRVTAWRDEWISPETQNRVPRWTALCPECESATVIGDASGMLEAQHTTVLLKTIISEGPRC